MAFLLSNFGRFLLRRLGGLAKSLATATTLVVGALLEAVVEALHPSHVCVSVWGRMAVWGVTDDDGDLWQIVDGFELLACLLAMDESTCSRLTLTCTCVHSCVG